MPPPEAPLARGSLAALLRARLADAGRDESVDGAAAVFAAAMLDAGGLTGAGAASLLREMRSAMLAATDGASAAEDIVDELRERARRKA